MRRRFLIAHRHCGWSWPLGEHERKRVQGVRPDELVELCSGEGMGRHGSLERDAWESGIEQWEEELFGRRPRSTRGPRSCRYATEPRVMQEAARLGPAGGDRWRAFESIA